MPSECGVDGRVIGGTPQGFVVLKLGHPVKESHYSEQLVLLDPTWEFTTLNVTSEHQLQQPQQQHHIAAYAPHGEC